MARSNPNGRNFIYRMRRNRSLRQKHLAHLLGYRSTSPISRFEAGTALPPLKVAFLMEIVLGIRLSDLYMDLYRELEHTALHRAERLPRVKRQLRGRLFGDDAP